MSSNMLSMSASANAVLRDDALLRIAPADLAHDGRTGLDAALPVVRVLNPTHRFAPFYGCMSSNARCTTA